MLKRLLLVILGVLVGFGLLSMAYATVMILVGLLR